jgi:hypothetical protein
VSKFEVFYTSQATQTLAITLDTQLVGNPALNPNKDVIGFFGLRLRLVF